MSEPLRCSLARSLLGGSGMGRRGGLGEGRLERPEGPKCRRRRRGLSPALTTFLLLGLLVSGGFGIFSSNLDRADATKILARPWSPSSRHPHHVEGSRQPGRESFSAFNASSPRPRPCPVGRAVGRTGSFSNLPVGWWPGRGHVDDADHAMHTDILFLEIVGEVPSSGRVGRRSGGSSPETRLAGRKFDDIKGIGGGRSARPSGPSFLRRTRRGWRSVRCFCEWFRVAFSVSCSGSWTCGKLALSRNSAPSGDRPAPMVSSVGRAIGSRAPREGSDGRPGGLVPGAISKKTTSRCLGPPGRPSPQMASTSRFFRGRGGRDRLQ